MPVPEKQVGNQDAAHDQRRIQEVDAMVGKINCAAEKQRKPGKTDQKSGHQKILSSTSGGQGKRRESRLTPADRSCQIVDRRSVT
jgi:hypothetical protein